MASLIQGLREASPEKVNSFRARDVRVLLKDQGLHPNTMRVLEALAESSHDSQKQVMAMANAMNTMTDIVASFAVIAEKMKERLDIPDDIKKDIAGLV
jgi:hypothetical protein